MKPSILSLILIPFSGTALAQSFDILRQDVTVDISTSTTTAIEMAAEVAAVGTTSELWMLVPPLPVASFFVDGAEATVRSHPQYPDLVKIVELPRTFEDGEAFSLVVRSEGALRCNSQLQPGTLACVRDAAQTIL